VGVMVMGGGGGLAGPSTGLAESEGAPTDSVVGVGVVTPSVSGGSSRDPVPLLPSPPLLLLLPSSTGTAGRGLAASLGIREKTMFTCARRCA
jgi:hypothetical protein